MLVFIARLLFELQYHRGGFGQILQQDILAMCVWKAYQIHINVCTETVLKFGNGQNLENFNWTILLGK